MQISYKVSSEENQTLFSVQHGSYVKLSTYTEQGTEFNIDFDINLYGLSELQVARYTEDFAKDHNRVEQLQKALQLKKQKGGIKFIWGFLSLITDGCYNKGYQRSRAVINQSSPQLEILFYQGLLSRKPSTVTISGKGKTRPSEKSFINVELLHIKGNGNSITIISSPKTNNLNNYLEDAHFGQKQQSRAVRYCGLPPIYNKQNNFNLQKVQNSQKISQRFKSHEQAASLLSYYHENVKNAREDQKKGPSVSRMTIALPTQKQFLNDSQYKSKLWLPNTLLKYCFLTPTRQRYISGYLSEIPAVENAFRIWKQTGINLRFSKTTNPSEAQIRIAFLNQGSYSYIGTDCLGIPKNQHTMNFGWRNIGQDGTAIHQIGHALGLYHEHQNPYCPIVWNQQEVIDSLQRNGNDWPIEQIRSNIFDKIPIGAAFSSKWDPVSIMHYNFDGSNIISPQTYRKNGIPRNVKLSTLDLDYIKRAYPPARSSNVQEKSGGEQIEDHQIENHIDATFHQICSILGQNDKNEEERRSRPSTYS